MRNARNAETTEVYFTGCVIGVPVFAPCEEFSAIKYPGESEEEHDQRLKDIVDPTSNLASSILNHITFALAL